jgi:hypothetical protein
MRNTIAAASKSNVCAIAHCPSRAEITPQDVAELRARLSGDAWIGQAEAEVLFAMERTATRKCREWTSFFVEAITDHVVWQARPTGVVNAAQADWLFQHVIAANTLNGYAALVNVLAEADRVPTWLAPALRSQAAAGLPDGDRALAEAAVQMKLAA